VLRYQRQNIPVRYHVGRARATAPYRERFSPLARLRHPMMSALAPLMGAERTFVR
jgi:hypothetical protein